MKNELGEISSAIITLKPHDHLCLIYESREEQYAAVIPYIKTGLERNEKCLYIIDESSFEDVRSALQAAGVEVDQALRRGALLILTKQDTYLKDGAFNPDRMMAVLEKMVKDALAEGFNALRVTGEMTWVLGEKSSIETLIEYESMVNKFYPNHQALAICQYNRQRFAAEIILDVIRTHPLVIYGSEVLRNDFFISPAYFGKKRQTEREVQLFLTTLQSLKKRQSELQEKEELLRQKESLLKTVRGERQSLQDRLNAITAYAYNMEYLLAQDGSLLYVTPSCERITGYTPEEFMANPGLIDEIVDPQDQPLFNAHQAEFLGRKDLTTGHEVNFRIIHRDGYVRWLHHVCQTVKDENGKIIGTYASNTDITSFKQAEQTARENETRFRQLIENAPQGIFIQTHHQFAYLNPTAVQLFGAKNAEDLIGSPVIDRFHPRVRDIVRQRIQQLNVQKHEVPTIEETYLRMDGSEFEVEVSAVPIHWHGSDGALVFFRDITEHKRTDEALRASEVRFRVAQEMSPDGFTILHPLKNEKGEVIDFSWVYENEAIARINGTDPKDVKGKRLLELFPSHQGTAIFEAYIQAAVTGNTQIIEEVYVGEIISKPTWLRLVIVPMGEDVAVLAQDISENKRLHEEIQESEEKYKALYEQSGDGIHLHTLDGRIVDVNETACWQSGYLKEELLNLSVFDLQPKISRKNLPVEKIQRQWKKWQAGEPHVLEADHQRKDGTVFPVEVTCTVVTIKDQKLILAMVKDISERKQVEEALRISESLFKKVFEILPIGLWIADKNGKLMQGNPAGVKIWGKEPRVPQSEYGLFKARRLPSGEEIAPEDWALAHTVNEGVTVVDELLEIEAFDGKKKIILNYTAPLLDSNGEVEGAIVVNQDITERMKAEMDLKESEERFRQVFESANVGKSITLPAGEISVNRAFAQMLGYKQEELRHKKWQELTPAEEIEPIKAMLEPLLRGEKDSARFSKRYIRKDGSTIWADVSMAILRDAQGRPKYFITTVVDITEAKRSREAESKLAQRIEAGLRAGNLAWWEMELPSGKVAFDNRKAEMLGYPPKKFKTYEDFTRLLHAEDHPKAMQAMRDHLEGRAEVYDVEYRIKTKSSGYKWLHDIGAITEREPQSGTIRLIGIVEDVSQRKEAELELETYSNRLEELVAERTQALEEAQQEILTKEKLATLGQLAGGVGHELRNPLSVISNAVYLLKATVAKENDKAREYAEMIAQQVQRSNKIISDLLDFARETTGASPSNVDVREVVAWVLQHFVPPEGVSVRTTFAKDLPTARADRQHMEQILANLVKNACQAMPEDGKLSVSAQGTAGEVQIAVRDNGAGISDENLKKLFSPLFTTKATGIGLGLATSKKLAEVNSGRIEVKSKEGEGSTFTLVLPAAGGSNDA